MALLWTRFNTCLISGCVSRISVLNVARKYFLFSVSTDVIKGSRVSPNSVDALVRVCSFGGIKALWRVKVISKMSRNSRGNVCSSKVKWNRG